MMTKDKNATTNSGKARTRGFYALGHEVWAADSRSPGTLNDFRRETCARTFNMIMLGGRKAAGGIMMQLVDNLGFNSVAAGNIAKSWRYALNDASSERPAEIRATPTSLGTSEIPA